MKMNSIKEKVFNFTEKFASKTGDYAIITKLTMEIKTFETKISSLNEKLGKAVFEKMKDNQNTLTADEDITSLIQQIGDFEERIANLHTEISDIRKKAEASKSEESATHSSNSSDDDTQQSDQ